jgi:preprotein translocase subunit YajC
MFLYALTLLAQEAPAEGKPAGGGGGLFDPWTLLMIGLPLVFLYLIVLNPNRKQERQRKAMLANLQKNDEVVTMGGIVGTVVSIKEKAGGVAGQEDVVTLRIDDRTRLTVLRSSIIRIDRDEQAASKNQPEKEESKAT